MKRRNPDGIFWLTLVWILGILLAKNAAFPLFILFGICFLSLILAVSIRKYQTFFLFLLVFLLANIRFQLFNHLPNQSIETIFSGKERIVQPIEGKIVSELTKGERSYRFLLDIRKINSVSVSGRIYFYTNDDSLRYGDVIQTVAQVQSFAEPSNPNSFDYNEMMKLRKVSGRGFAITPIRVIDSKPNFYNLLIITVRSWLRNQIQQRFGAESGFFKAILIGEKSDIGDMAPRLNRAGLSHLLAVSGLHVGIIAFVLYLVLKLIVRRRNIARICLIIALVFYAAICNWSPSVTRAMLMISLLLLGQMLQRKANPNNIIAASLIIITAINPNQLFSIGLQLSYIAVFTLLNMVPNIRFLSISDTNKSGMNFIKKTVNGILIVMFSSLILSVVLTPLTLFHFHQVNLNGVFANVIAIPMMAIMLPLSILCLVLPSGIAAVYLAALRFLFLLFDKWSLWSATLPLHFTFIRFSTFQFAIALLLIGAFPFFTSKKVFKTLCISLFLINIAIGFVSTASPHLIVTFFDCGLGDMVLIETNEKERIMIDTGPPDFAQGHFAQSAQGYFQSKGISTIDWLIVTHAHNDHYGGLEYILKELTVKQLVVTEAFQKRNIWHFFQPLLSATSVFSIQDTLSIPLKNVSLKVLHPDSSYFHNNINNMSIVIKMNYEDLTILFTGDAEEEAEHHLLGKYAGYLPSNVLKVGHHGSKTSSSESFIELVSPNYVFIPTSLKNRFHFPHEITLQKYAFLEDRMFIAGFDGALQIKSDGKTNVLHTFRSQKTFFEKVK